MISQRGFLIGLTQWLNATFGGNPDQSFSGCCALAAERGLRRGIVAEAAVNLIFALVTGERDHCRRSVEADEQ